MAVTESLLLCFSMEINNLRKIIYMRKTFLLKELQFIKSLKIWWSMALFVMFHQMFNDFILSAMLLQNDVIDSNYRTIKCFTKPFGSRTSFR